MAIKPDQSQDTAKLDSKDANTIALKYLELARSEILERIKVGYQILTAYAGAVGALGAWINREPSQL